MYNVVVVDCIDSDHTEATKVSHLKLPRFNVDHD